VTPLRPDFSAGRHPYREEQRYGSQQLQRNGKNYRGKPFGRARQNQLLIMSTEFVVKVFFDE